MSVDEAKNGALVITGLIIIMSYLLDLTGSWSIIWNVMLYHHVATKHVLTWLSLVLSLMDFWGRNSNS